MVFTAAPPAELKRQIGVRGAAGAACAAGPHRHDTWLSWRLAIAVALVLLMLTVGTLPRELRIRQAAAPYAFHLVDWLLGRLDERSGHIGAGLLGLRADLDRDGRAAVTAYFGATGAGRERWRGDAEDAIERALTSALVDAGFGAGAPWADRGRIVFPPASFTFVAPPRVLVVSPRARIGTSQAELLRPGLSDDDAATLESMVDDSDVVSLVVSTGGLATYPAMVLEGSRPTAALAAVAHEWSHGYLFFSPLGLRYWSSSEARAINETAAEMVGQELGAVLLRELGFGDVQPPPGPIARGRDREFGTILRATRIEVERLLALGQIEAAEALMRGRRDELAALGFEVRKLNQAYFAFYGSYGDAAAGASPIPAQLRQLRAESASVAQFLRRVGELTGAADLTRALDS